MAVLKAVMVVAERVAGESRFQANPARYANDLCVTVSRCWDKVIYSFIYLFRHVTTST